MPLLKQQPSLADDPLWYKDGVIYQLHIKAFFDSNADGIGDFAGLTQKLDYLQDLGVTALWLLPFYPSPLRDDGYDIAAYTDVHPNYGDLAAFKTFLTEARRRGLRVITELVINHTSDQHPWFQRARTAEPGSRWRNFYVWTDDPSKYKEARIIFKDFETSNWSWDPVAKAYYWHRFYHHQPDLNFENPEVHRAVEEALDFWMEMGVDGLRLDAIPYLYEREGTSCENLAETHVYLKELRAHVDRKFTNRMLLAEANQWPEDARPYFGDGDECHVAFHFPLMPRLYMSVAMEDRFPIIDILDQTPDIPENCQWAIFLRNHDELTLEMVTDEDRDYMYRTYAQDVQARINLGIRRRLAPLLGNHRRRIELMNALLFSFPGTPIVYYGDEIGMGDNIYLGDRNGVRTPMQWSPDRNAGFSRTNPQRLYLPVIIDPEYHYEAVNVEGEQRNPDSLLWWMKRIIDLRKRLKALGRGTMEFLHPENRKVLAFVRTHEDQTILVVANLSRFSQHVELDLSRFRGKIPVEVFGQSDFPRIEDRPYSLTLSPHFFFWLILEDRLTADEAIELSARDNPLTRIRLENEQDLFNPAGLHRLDGALAAYVVTRRWFGGKARPVKVIEIDDLLAVGGSSSQLAILRVEFVDGSEDRYALPLAARWDLETALDDSHRDLAIAILETADRHGVLVEAFADSTFSLGLFSAIAEGRQTPGLNGTLTANPIAGATLPASTALEAPSVMRVEQSNTSIAYGTEFFLKLFRRLEAGVNTDFEITRFLSEKTEFRNIPRLLGGIEYRREGEPHTTLAMLQEFVPHAGDAWKYSLDSLGRYFDRIVSQPFTPDQVSQILPDISLVALTTVEVPPAVRATLGSYLSDVELLGKRTAELHVALASRPDDADFAPEVFTPFYQRSIYQHMRTQAIRSMQQLRDRMSSIPADLQSEAAQLLGSEAGIITRFRGLLDRKIDAKKLRVHGDYHLGQILHTGKDFLIVDFEGEPSRPLSERRIKRTPIKDVAGMIRSFHYAPYAVLFGQASGVNVRVEDATALQVAAQVWQRWTSVIFLRSYLEAATPGRFLPEEPAELEILLDAYLMEKVLYELVYELNNRPEWVSIPLRGLLELLEARS